MRKKLVTLMTLLDSVNLKKESNKISLLVKEAASKLNALKKLGFSDKTAEEIDNICKGFSMWIAYRLIDHVSRLLKFQMHDLSGQSHGKEVSKQNDYIDYINDNFRNYKSNVTYIMDWVKIGLDGEYTPYKNTSFEELITLAKDWHDSLEESGGDINYQEKNKIILDFRDSDGNGYYWVNLETSRCDEESDRMGHCGTTAYRNTLYSLRRVVPMGRGYTMNKSILTAAVTPDGKIAQLKGAKNSKPQQEYHQYIVPLLNIEAENRDGSISPVISGFSSEYDSASDFKLGDLSREQISELIVTNPRLFDGVAGKINIAYALNEPARAAGLIGRFGLSKDLLDSMFKAVNRNVSSMSRLVDIIRDPELLFRWYEDYSVHMSIEHVLRYLDDKSKNNIIKTYEEKSGGNLIGINLQNFEEKIKEEEEIFYDLLIMQCVYSSINQAAEYAAYEEIKKIVIDGLSEFGVPEIIDGDVFLTINIFDFINSIYKNDRNEVIGFLEEIESDGGNDLSYMASSLLQRCFDEAVLRPRIINTKIDDVISDKKVVNEIFRDCLLSA
jgi:hypothetical protein